MDLKKKQKRFFKRNFRQEKSKLVGVSNLFFFWWDIRDITHRDIHPVVGYHSPLKITQDCGMVVGHLKDSYPYRTTVGIQVEKVWTLEQIFGTFYVYVPIRATILKAGGLS